MHFDLADMRLMVHVAAHSSLTKGAESSHISVPAASIRIKNLEDGIGGKLLHRTSQGVTLTTLGSAFVEHARTVLSQVEHLQVDLKDHVKGVKGRVRVGANHCALGEFLPPVLCHYLLLHPDVTIDLRELDDHDIVRAVSDGQTDIGIVEGGARTDNLQVIPYRTDRMALVVPEGHDFASRNEISFAETLDEDFVGVPEAASIEATVNQVCSAMDRHLRVRVHGGDREMACRLIEARVGVGLMPLPVALRHARTMAIVALPLTDEWARRALKICVGSMDALPAIARDLVELFVCHQEGEDTALPASAAAASGRVARCRLDAAGARAMV